MNSPWETHSNGQDQPFVQLGCSPLQSQIDCLSPQLTMNKSFTYKEHMTWISRATPNAPKSCTIQEMLGENGL